MFFPQASEKMKILVTNGAYKHTLALVRALGAAGHSLGVIGHHWAAVSFFSKYCSRRHVIKTDEKELFVDKLLEILQKEHYDVLLPVGLPTVAWIAERANEIQQFTHLPLADVDKIRLFEDKKATYDLALTLNIPTPLTFFPKDRLDADICAAKLTPPIVVKHCKKSGADYLKYAQTKEEAVKFFENMTAISEIEGQMSKEDSPKSEIQHRKSKNTEGSYFESNILFQEYLSGGGFGFFGLYENGIFKQGFAHKRIREFPVSGGSSSCAESIDNEILTYYGRKILEAVGWHGVAMVEFKMDGNGQPRLLEVNPKLWGSFDLSVAAGVPFAEKWVKLAINEPMNDHQNYKTGVRFSWLADGDLKNGLETGNFWKILRGPIFEKNTTTNLIWSDPIASLFLILRNLRV